jgi:hypothetical protein
MTNTYEGSTSTANSGRLVTGLFPDRDSAEAAYSAAHGRGYSKDDLNVVMSDETREKHFSGTTAGKETELGNKAAGGGLVGALVGMNIPEERVKESEQGVKQGGILMGVHARNDDDAAHFEDQWRTSGGQSVYR